MCGTSEEALEWPALIFTYFRPEPETILDLIFEYGDDDKCLWSRNYNNYELLYWLEEKKMSVKCKWLKQIKEEEFVTRKGCNIPWVLSLIHI